MLQSRVFNIAKMSEFTETFLKISKRVNKLNIGANIEWQFLSFLVKLLK